MIAAAEERSERDGNSGAKFNTNTVALALCLFLCAVTWLVFGQTLRHDFVNYDDEKHITRNKHINQGLTTSGVVWAFTRPLFSNWHPVTTVSHMLDCKWYGVTNARGHHLTNVLAHNAAVILLFFVLWQMTGAIWRSVFVATLFAIHPLHVESVAWIAERKDVLSGLFFMITLAAYVSYVRRPSMARYFAVVLAFALGLLSKPMVVTLPFVLLLLDYWPLRRFDRPSSREPKIRFTRWLNQRPIPFRLLIEKIPLVVLAVASSVTALHLQGKQIELMESLSLPWRLANAMVTVVTYMWQLVWPRNLAVFYPHPKESLALLTICAATVFVVAVSATVWMLRRNRPYLFTGWLWYLIMLLPIIGIVQVGFQAHADRYTYLPHIGLFIMGTWAVADLPLPWKRRPQILIAAAVMVVTVLTWQARIQTSYWRDSETLWRHALAVTSSNNIAHNNLATILTREGRIDEAIVQLQGAIQAEPRARSAHHNLAGAFLLNGQVDQAISYYEKELEINPDHADAENNLGHALLQIGRTEAALEHFRKFVQLRPNSATAYYNLAVALQEIDKLEEAIAHYRQVLALKPNYPDARKNLYNALLQDGQFDEAMKYLPKK